MYVIGLVCLLIIVFNIIIMSKTSIMDINTSLAHINKIIWIIRSQQIFLIIFIRFMIIIVHVYVIYIAITINIVVMVWVRLIVHYYLLWEFCFFYDAMFLLPIIECRNVLFICFFDLLTVFIIISITLYFLNYIIHFNNKVHNKIGFNTN